MRNLYLAICLLFFLSCDNLTIPGAERKTNYKDVPNYSSQNIVSSSKLQIDTITISAANENEMTSLRGTFFLKDSVICFADMGLSAILMYNLEGKYIGNLLTKGKGPREVVSLRDAAYINNTLIVSGNWIITYFDSLMNVTKSFRMGFNRINAKDGKLSVAEMTNNPTPDMFSIYEIETRPDPLKCWGEKYLVIPIVTDHINYNGYNASSSADHFYKNSYTIGILDTESGFLSDMIITRSSIYSKHKYLPKFKNTLYDIDGDIMYYTFQADSLIYTYNLKDRKLINSFGYKGIDMNTNYPKPKTYEDSENIKRNDYGFYSSIKYIKATNLLFRSYHKGDKNSVKSGVQIYKDMVLIGDYDVPDGFVVFGYREPYYYAYGKHNTDNGDMYVYKFRL